MEAAVPRWQQGFTRAFCQRGWGSCGEMHLKEDSWSDRVKGLSASARKTARKETKRFGGKVICL